MNPCPDIKQGEDAPCTHYIIDPLKPGMCSHPEHFRCEEFIHRKGPVLSPWAINTWTECRYKFLLSYFYGTRVLAPKPAPLSGQLLDANLGVLHAESDEDRQAEQDRLDALMEYIASLEMEEIPDMILKADAMMEAYPQLDIPMPLGIPQKKAVKKYDGYTLLSIPDLWTFLQEERAIKLYDWKYTSNPDSYDAIKVRVIAGINLFLHDASCITFRIISKPFLRRFDNNAGRESDEKYQERIVKDILRRPKHYVQDKTFYRGEFDFEKIQKEIGYMALEIQKGLDMPEEYFYKNETSCYFGNRHEFPCDFLAVCKSGVISSTIYERRIV